MFDQHLLATYCSVLPKSPPLPFVPVHPRHFPKWGVGGRGSNLCLLTIQPLQDQEREQVSFDPTLGLVVEAT